MRLAKQAGMQIRTDERTRKQTRRLSHHDTQDGAGELLTTPPTTEWMVVREMRTLALQQVLGSCGHG